MLYQNYKDNLNTSKFNPIKIIDLIIAKQRNGPIGTIKLKFDKTRAKYLEM